MQFLATLNQFEQCVLNMSLINICDSQSYVGQEMRRKYQAWKALTDEVIHNPWLDVHQFTIYLPHPKQAYEDITLEAGLSRGYNVEVNPVKDPGELFYTIPPGGHFVVVLRQKQVDGDFTIAATGIFVRSLGILSLDVIVDLDQEEYQSLVIKHPIIRDYPQDWENKLKAFLRGEIRWDALPPIVGHVDRDLNQDYSPPDWNQVHLAASGFINL